MCGSRKTLGRFCFWEKEMEKWMPKKCYGKA